jgi:uncharacterized delta-60 repeat protein
VAFQQKSRNGKQRRYQINSTGSRLQRLTSFQRKLSLEPLEDRRLLSTIMSAQLNSNPGWTTSGQWAFGQPAGLTQNPTVSYPDPTSGYTGLNVYGVNLYGDYNLTVGGPYFLKTAAIDCSNFTNVNLSFRRWLNTDAVSWVSATVEVSSNGTTWNSVFRNTDGIVDYAWQSVQYDIGSTANNKATVYIRWGYQVFQTDAYQCSGWNIDDILVTGDPSAPPPGVTVAPTSGLSTTEAGGTAAFTMVLNSQPTANVTIGLSSSDTTEGTVSPASVTFTSSNWSTPQTVTITGVNDTLVDGNIAYNVVTAAASSTDSKYNGLNPADVSATNLDNDVATLTLSLGSPTVSEAAGAHATTGTVTRNTDTTNSLVVTLTSSDPSEATVPATVTIPAGQSSATFDISAVDDAIIDGTQTVTISASAPIIDNVVGLDSSFGTGGLATTSLDMNFQPPNNALAVQSDGKILAASESTSSSYAWHITRLKSDGSLDTSFGSSGIVDTEFSTAYPSPKKILVQPDGKILVGGVFRSGSNILALARYNANGSLDTSFGSGGIASFPGMTDQWIEDMVQQPDGKTLLALGIQGDVYTRVARLNANGSLDTTFGSGGIKTFDTDGVVPRAIALLADGRFLLSGDYTNESQILRAYADGSLDTTFGTAGIQTVNFGSEYTAINSIVIDHAGRIVLGGSAYYSYDNTANFAAARLNPNGSFDTSFSQDGIALVDFPTGWDDLAFTMVVQTDDKIVLSGYSENYDYTSQVAIARLKVDGTLDTSFDGDGRLLASISSYSAQQANRSVLLPDGKLLLLAGWSNDWRIAKYKMGITSLSGTATLNVTDNDDTSPPIVTGQVPTPGSVINTSSISIDITFSKPVVGVDATDLVLTGTAAVAAAKGTPTNVSGNTWRFPISGLRNGSLNISLAPDANDIEDSVGRDLANVTWSYTVALAYVNNTPIIISSDSEATPYPSTINVSNLSGTITDVNVTLTGLTHTWPEDIDILLVGPAGQKVVILSDVGSGTDISNVNLTLDDAAANSLSTSTTSSGTYKPTNLDSTTDSFSSPAPSGPYASTLAAFNGTNPNGTWSLYIFDDSIGESGSISGGWSLTILTTCGTAVIGDTVFNDLNSNGMQDSGETGVANWDVYLDSNANGQWDSSEPKTTTDANGNYAFNNLASGTYRVAEVPRTGWTQTAPASPGYYNIMLADGQTRNDVDFGNHELPTKVVSIIASVDGTVQDKEPDGVFETLDTTSTLVFAGSYPSGYTSGDQRGVFEFNLSSLVSAGDIVSASLSFQPGQRGYRSSSLLNFSVYGYAGDGVVSLSDATSSSTLIGTFQADINGVYTIPLNASFIQSLRSTGSYFGIMLRELNIDYSYIGIYSLEYGYTVLKPTLNLSTLILPPAEIRSSVWNDLDADGVQDAGEPGIAGTGVEIYSSSDSTIGNGDDVLVTQTVTDNAGNYVLGNLPPNANYYLKFRAPVGYTFTAKDAGGNDALDSDANSTGVTALFTLSNGQSDVTRDTGMVGSAPSFGFASHVGASNGSEGDSIATDANGNIYMTGYLSGTADFDSGPGTYSLSTSNNNQDAYVAKYSSTGSLLWARRIGGANHEFGEDIAVAADGSVYTVGWFQGMVDFDPGPATFNLTSANTTDIFIQKLDSSGNFVWARRLGSESSNYPGHIALALTADGSVYTTGYFLGTADFDPGTAVFNLTSAGTGDIFVSKLDSSGNFVWACGMGGTGSDLSEDIAVASDGSVVVTGYYSGTADFDPGPNAYNLTSAGNSDVFVAKLDSSGNFLWARSMGGSDVDSGTSLAVAGDGNIYITGHYCPIIS